MDLLEQLRSTRLDIESQMFADASAKSIYENNIKHKLIHKNGVENTASGRKAYLPSMTTNVENTLGVTFNDGMGNYGDISNEFILAQNSRHAEQIFGAFRDDAYSVTSQGTPQYLTTIWTNNLFEVITRANVFDKVSHSFQQGMFGITNIKIPTVSYASNYALYSDFGVQGDSSINVNWIDRQIVNFERTLIYGDLAVAQMSMGKIDYINQLREGMLRQVKLHQDAIGFFGYSTNMEIYGLLNDPSLNPSITAGVKAGAPSGSASTLWVYGIFFEIIADIASLFNAVISRAGGQVDGSTKSYLLIPPVNYTSIVSVTSPLGNITVRKWIEDTYPNMEIIQAPLLQGTGSPIGSTVANQIVLIFDNIEGQPCLLNAFATLYNSHGVVRLASSFQEKISYALGGAIVSNAIGIQIMGGS